MCNSLLFGASASVFAFIRVSRSLSFLLNKVALIPSSVFFDDFPLFTPSSSGEEADKGASELLDLLGWRHAKSGKKGLPFSRAFDVLGLNLHLEALDHGRVSLENKAGRLEKIATLVQEVQERDILARAEAQKIQGLLNFASGFYSGRALTPFARSLSRMVDLPGCDGLAQRARGLLSLLRGAKPRVLSVGDEKVPVVIFTDGSWENGKSGLGSIIFDPTDGFVEVVSGECPAALLKAWENQVGKQIICQLELYMLVLVRSLYAQRLQGRRALFFIDNEAARFAVIKGGTDSPSLATMCRVLATLDQQHGSYNWVERVPSLSNPADTDAPSRGDTAEPARLFGAVSVSGPPGRRRT